MDITVSPWITAGFAATVAAAGAIAVTTVAPPVSIPAPQTHEVQLVSGDVSWDVVLQTALANSTEIYDHLAPATFADIQQFAANIPSYLDGSRNFETDLGLAYKAATTPFLPTDPEPYIYSSISPTESTLTIETLLGNIPIDLASKADLLQDLTTGIPYSIGFCPLCLSGNIDVLSLLLGSDVASEVKPYIDFSGSPLSGILWGSFGTTVGPLLQINDDVTAITAALSGATPDYTTAFNDLLDMPANVTNAFLNGYGEINLDTLLTDFGISAPSGVDVSAIELDLGGLLSPAGSLIDGLGFTDALGDCSVLCVSLDVPNSLVGPLASLFLQDQAIAEAIGWDGVGQPLAALFSDLTGMFN